MSACVWCKRNEQIDAYLGVCSLQCSRAYEAYERGKVDERDEGAAVTRALVYVSKSACELEQELIDAAVAWRQFKGNAEDGAYPWVRLLSAMEQAIDAVIADREATR